MRALCPALAALIVGWLGACANQGAPPGGPEDRRPPVVVRTEPDTFAVLTDLNSPVRFYFDERISEAVSNGSLDDAVTVSPLTGEVHVHHSSRSLSVELQGGFRPGLVYRVTLLPVVSDLFGNRLRDPFELVFSTGGTAAPTTVAGEVWDRITGQGVDGAVVHAVGADSLVYVALSDAQGIYAFRYLPPGTFTLTGFEDSNRDGKVGERETQGSASATVAVGDTALVYIPVLVPDTTPAMALRASALDSVTAVVEFDDYLDPGQESSAIGVTLTRESGPAPGVRRVLLEREYAEYVDQVTDSLARLDSLDAARAAAAARDSATAVDTLVASDTLTAPDTAVARDTLTAPDTVVARDTLAAPDTAALAGRPVARIAAPRLPRRQPPPRLPGSARAGGAGAVSGPSGEVLPGRRIVVLVDGPLVTDVEYHLSLSSIININGLGGGGGDVTLVRPAPEAADSTATSAEPDSAGANVLPRDSVSVLPTPAPNR